MDEAYWKIAIYHIGKLWILFSGSRFPNIVNYVAAHVCMPVAKLETK